MAVKYLALLSGKDRGSAKVHHPNKNTPCQAQQSLDHNALSNNMSWPVHSYPCLLKGEPAVGQDVKHIVKEAVLTQTSILFSLSLYASSSCLLLIRSFVGKSHFVSRVMEPIHFY